LPTFVVVGVLDDSYSNRTLSVVWIYISFMARDGEHFFMRFLAIWTSSFEKVLLPIPLLGRLSFFVLPVYSSYQSFV
jgi:hypothetical protein